MNLTRTQKKELASLGTQASKILNFGVAPIENELYKHSIELVRKCIKENVCSNFLEYFKINFHNKFTTNKELLLVIPKVKLEFARSKFFFLGAKLYNLLPREIRLSESEADFMKKVKLFITLTRDMRYIPALTFYILLLFNKYLYILDKID